MKMKSGYILPIFAAMLLASSCAKEASEGLNDAAKRYFDAWIEYNHPDAQKTELGAYILEDIPGSGESPEDSAYVRVNYSYYDLNNNLIGTSTEGVARQNGIYNKRNYYGPAFFYRGEKLDNLTAGLEEAISTMRLGGKRKVVIPGWLGQSGKRYSSAEKYVEKCSGTDYIYELELLDAIDDVERWEKDSLARFMAANYPDAEESTDMPGFYYLKLRSGYEDYEITADSTIYINYTGRMLDGKVFDSNVADTAKVWGFYSASNTYEPTKVNWDDDDYSNITITTSETSVITGFSYGLSKMHSKEKAMFFFYSGYGYSFNGSGYTIPPYSPLIFEIDMVEN